MAKSFCCSYGLQLVAIETAEERDCLKNPPGKYEKYTRCKIMQRAALSSCAGCIPLPICRRALMTFKVSRTRYKSGTHKSLVLRFDSNAQHLYRCDLNAMVIKAMI
jgi:hypothetical protein